VQILDKERQSRRAKRAENGGKSSFVWNEIVFNSFKAGYLKQLDFEFYKRLESAISKRMYRFLDKRFYHRQRLEFDLRTFACEHIGLAKGYHNGELKRVLRPAIAELEEQGFLKRLPEEERFICKMKGEWSAVFVRAGKEAAQVVEQEGEVVKALIERGVTRSSARKLVADHDEARIREKIAFFDWLVTRKDKRIGRSPAGFLFRAIEEDFALPDEYLATRAEKPTKKVTKLLPLQSQTPHEKTPSRLKVEHDAIDSYWNSIGAEEQVRIEKELVKNAPPFLREQYVDGQKERGVLFQAVRRAIIEGYVRKCLEKQSQAA